MPSEKGHQPQHPKNEATQEQRSSGTSRDGMSAGSMVIPRLHRRSERRTRRSHHVVDGNGSNARGASGGRGRGPARPPFRTNLTPLIDVTFLLIVFFVLVAEITRTQVAEEIDLPQPDPTAAVERDAEEGALILNLIPAANARLVSEVRVAGMRFDPDATGLVRLTSWLADEAATDPLLSVELRADRGIDYANVYPIMKAISAAGITSVELVVSEPDTSARGVLRSSAGAWTTLRAGHRNDQDCLAVVADVVITADQSPEWQMAARASRVG